MLKSKKRNFSFHTVKALLYFPLFEQAVYRNTENLTYFL